MSALLRDLFGKDSNANSLLAADHRRQSELLEEIHETEIKQKDALIAALGLPNNNQRVKALTASSKKFQDEIKELKTDAKDMGERIIQLERQLKEKDAFAKRCSRLEEEVAALKKEAADRKPVQTSLHLKDN